MRFAYPTPCAWKRRRAASAGVRLRVPARRKSDGRPDRKETEMADKLKGRRIAFLVATEGTEQVELTEPWKAVQEAGGTPELISTEAGEVQAFNHLDKGDTFKVDRTVQE